MMIRQRSVYDRVNLPPLALGNLLAKGDRYHYIMGTITAHQTGRPN
jgi:hypothetical protein